MFRFKMYSSMFILIYVVDSAKIERHRKFSISISILDFDNTTICTSRTKVYTALSISMFKSIEKASVSIQIDSLEIR